MTVRRVVLLSAAACLLLASSHAFAQAPPAAPDADQRLKALEDKMDRVIKLLEPRTPISAAAITDKHLALITEARDALMGKYEQAQKAYADFQRGSPILVWGHTDANVTTQRLAKDTSTLQDLQQRQAEVAVRTTQVKNVGEDEKEARAMLVLLQRRGVDVEVLRRTVAPGRDERVTAVDLVRLYGASLRQEAEELQHLVQSAEDRITRDRKMVREMSSIEALEQQLRADRDQSLKILDAVAAQLTKIDIMRQQQAPK